MARFTDSIGTFQTGDLVFVRYPPRGTQPIHVTVFLDSSSPRGAGYLHAGDKTLERDTHASYAEYKELGGYLHACSINADLRAAVADVAGIFALDTVKPTPYGHYPNKDDVTRVAGKAVESPRANRFGGMIGTRNVSEIPFEFPALHRLLKWTHRAMVKAPLSEHRGITCAAFAAACHQVAGMRGFLADVGIAYKPEVLRDAVSALDELTVSKSDLRKGLELIGEDATTGKTIYKGQALPVHSNRRLSEKGLTTLKDMAQTNVEGKTRANEWVVTALETMGLKPGQLSAVERTWLVVQVKFLGISEYQVCPLSKIIDPDFFFDAKYVSSPALSSALVASKTWKTTLYESY